MGWGKTPPWEMLFLGCADAEAPHPSKSRLEETWASWRYDGGAGGPILHQLVRVGFDAGALRQSMFSLRANSRERSRRQTVDEPSATPQRVRGWPLRCVRTFDQLSRDAVSSTRWVPRILNFFEFGELGRDRRMPCQMGRPGRPETLERH